MCIRDRLWGALFLIGNLIWTDVLHVNPNRSQANVISMLWFSPLISLFGALLISELAVLAAVIQASLVQAIWGRIPLWAVFLMLPVCTYALHLQVNLVGYSDDKADFGHHQFWRAALTEFPVLLGCWLSLIHI